MGAAPSFGLLPADGAGLNQQTFAASASACHGGLPFTSTATSFAASLAASLTAAAALDYQSVSASSRHDLPPSISGFEKGKAPLDVSRLEALSNPAME